GSVICLAVAIVLARLSLAQTATKTPGSAASQNITVTVVDENNVAVTSALVFLQASSETVALRYRFCRPLRILQSLRSCLPAPRREARFLLDNVDAACGSDRRCAEYRG